MNNNNTEGFWGSTAYTPVSNRLYPSYPFGWHGPVQQPDFPRCLGNPYDSTDWLKSQINQEKPFSAIAPIYWEKQGDRMEQQAAMISSAHEGKEKFIDIRLGSELHREMIRTAIIIAMVAFVLLALFHKYS